MRYSKAVFAENAREYKKVLSLKTKDVVRETMYAEVPNAIASFENGLATEINPHKMSKDKHKTAYQRLERCLLAGSNN